MMRGTDPGTNGFAVYMQSVINAMREGIAKDMVLPKPIVEKIRYKITHEGKTWDVDEFLGDNMGLIIAEIELDEENETFSLPDWAGEEVTGETKYYNANLIKNPFKNWSEET